MALPAQQVRDLPIGTKFRIAGDVYELLFHNASRAHVRLLKTEHVRLPNGKEFERPGQRVNISPNIGVDEVLR